MLQLVVPALFQTPVLLDMNGEQRLSGIDLLLGRGQRVALGISSIEEILCRELGIARQQDWPVAPISWAVAGKVPGEDYWLRADPVYVRIERDHLVLAEKAVPTVEEASLLCESLARHFGEEFSPHPLRPNEWVVRVQPRPNLVTTSLSQALGQNIDPLLPAGTDAKHWRKLLNEVQMLLFHHPVNQAREQRGETPINSVWLWGGGSLPEAIPKTDRTLLSNITDWQSLARFAGAAVNGLPEMWSPDIPDNGLIVLDEAATSIKSGNHTGWLRGIKKLETNWLQPLIAGGRPFRIDDPIQAKSLLWRNAYRWKFWKRAPKPMQQTFSISPPSSDPGIDAFGNRY